MKRVKKEDRDWCDSGKGKEKGRRKGSKRAWK